MKILQKTILALFTISLCSTVVAAVRSDVTAVIDNANLNATQHKALVQYAESLDSIVNVDLQNRDSIILVNKNFMGAQQCLAMVYSIDQKPHMMQVSRKVYETTFNTNELITKYREFLGQAQQEGDNALPSSAKACK